MGQKHSYVQPSRSRLNQEQNSLQSNERYNGRQHINDSQHRQNEQVNQQGMGQPTPYRCPQVLNQQQGQGQQGQGSQLSQIQNSYVQQMNQQNQQIIKKQEVSAGKVVKNQVSLIKKDLKLVRDQQSPDIYHIKFSINADKKCGASILIMAQEEDKSQMIQSIEDPKPKQYFDVGRNLQCPLDNTELANELYIDTSKYRPEQLTQAQDKIYPIVIRLEYLSDEAQNEDQNLQELPVGSYQPNWVYSQTTYCILQSSENKGYQIKIAKQKLWIDGSTYELQEVYGIDYEHNITKDAGGSDCVICLENKKNTIIIPCRHLCICSACADVLINTRDVNQKQCPICRTTIHQVFKLNRESNIAGYASQKLLKSQSSSLASNQQPRISQSNSAKQNIK